MTTHPSFADLLERAVREPGVLSQAYHQFYGYSIGNRLLALAQCAERRIPPGPINTFPGWKALGRYVRKGERALTLCMPIQRKRQQEHTDPETGERSSEDLVWTQFVFKPHWFTLAQTEGQDLPPAPIPSWQKDQALSALDIQEVPFDLTDGNALGFARERSIALNPCNPLPWKTTFHEVAHVLLGHTSEGLQADGERTPRNLREAEAESVALLCCEALGLAGAAECRGYVQHWWGHGNPIPERSAQRILKVADQILRAGQAVES